MEPGLNLYEVLLEVLSLSIPFTVFMSFLSYFIYEHRGKTFLFVLIFTLLSLTFIPIGCYYLEDSAGMIVWFSFFIIVLLLG